ncbi:MAG: hypothetical protein DI537_05120 [Stutzerimonas stutzeri]|nr:MAG: hypothetical protein DI537_05120 [Stutzerimonas stutzeri]
MIPTLSCSAVRIDDPSETAVIDLSPVLLNLDCGRAADLLARMGARRTVYAQELSSCIPDGWREHFWASNVKVPDMAESAVNFLAELNGEAGLRSWRALAAARQEARWGAASARKLQKAVHAASFTPASQSASAMLYDDISDTYANDADEAVDRTYSHDDLVAAVGSPPWDSSETDRDAYSRRAHEWVRSHGRPFAFSTRPRRWAGITSEDLLSILEDEPAISESHFLERVWSCLETDLSDNHHDNAYEELRRPDDLTNAARSWLEAYRSGAEASKAFAGVRDWNDSQGIVSHFPDYTAVVGLFSDVTEQEVRDWVDAHVRAAERALDDVNGLWRPVISAPDKAIEEAAGMGITLSCGPSRSSRQTWRWINAATGERSTEFLTLELCVETLPTHRQETGKAT